MKIGDYGLTKAISASHHVSHTITVGTVHYMAPEVGQGRYDRSIDIYALGILLYEMLTGQVPFLGSSPAEILMKHMTAAPDLTNIEEPFARVIRKALAKDPAERYQSVQEMVEDVFGTENIRNSVSQFAPEELSVVAEHIAQKIHGAKPKRRDKRLDQPAGEKDFSKEIGKKAEQFAKKAEALRRIREEGGSFRQSMVPEDEGRGRADETMRPVPGGRSAQLSSAASLVDDRHPRHGPGGRLALRPWRWTDRAADGGRGGRHDFRGFSHHPAGAPTGVARPRRGFERVGQGGHVFHCGVRLDAGWHGGRHGAERLVRDCHAGRPPLADAHAVWGIPSRRGSGLGWCSPWRCRCCWWIGGS